ncbi:MAG: CAAX prenyl protease-related protein [Longimicrobiales bacterium]|jgi:CAAX prenyl protease-like protein|nr:CAAX prenyl protease-related protein [Longimicrobiales bacterium]
MSERPGLARSFPFGLYIGIMVLEPLLQPLLPAGVDERWLYGVKVALVFVALALLWRYYTELADIRSARGSDWAWGVGIGVAVFGLWILLDFRPLAFAPAGGFDPRAGGSVDLGLAAMRLAGAILIVPVMEELFWRSFLFRWLQHPSFLSVEPGAVGLRALIFSSALFASEHRLWFAGLLAGLAYAWLYKRSGNLWVPILAHAVTNGLLGAYVLATGSWDFW